MAQKVTLFLITINSTSKFLNKYGITKRNWVDCIDCLDSFPGHTFYPNTVSNLDFIRIMAGCRLYAAAIVAGDA